MLNLLQNKINNQISNQKEVEVPKSKLQQKLFELLEYYGIASEGQLIQIMTNPIRAEAFRKIYLKGQIKERIPKNQLTNLAQNYSYQQIFSYFSSFDQHALKVIRYVVMTKYSRQDDEVIRTHSSRKKLWLLMSGAWSSLKQKNNVFELLNEFGNYQDYFGRIIQADVLRTIHEQDNKEEMRKRMSKILFSFARKNPYIGYCQGMNFIASFLLTMQFTDEEVFWLLTSILQNFTPFNYYTNMMGVAVDIKILDYLAKIHYPKIHAKLTQIGVDLSIFMLEWLVCLFTSILPFYLLVIVWDLFFMQGSVILIKTCLVLLEYMGQLILESTDFGTFFIEFEKLKKKIYIEEGVFLQKVRALQIDNKVLRIARQIFQFIILKQKQDLKVDSTQAINKNWKEVNCNVEWPICFHQLKKHKINEDNIDVWVFRDQNGPKMITDYLGLKNRKSVKIKEQKQSQNKLVIGRIPHICDIKSYEEKQQANNRGIELDEFDLGIRRVNKNLQGLFHISTTQFYRRATANHSFFFVRRSPMVDK